MSIDFFAPREAEGSFDYQRAKKKLTLCQPDTRHPAPFELRIVGLMTVIFIHWEVSWRIAWKDPPWGRFRPIQWPLRSSSVQDPDEDMHGSERGDFACFPRRAYEKPSERRVPEKAQAISRHCKPARKQLEREGLIPRSGRPPLNSAKSGRDVVRDSLKG
jgi:hypothetical protein